MAAIFQIRRGTPNVSLAEGELYLHQGSGSIQFSSGSNTYNLLPLNAPAYGDINLSGSISASGDVRIGGNIYLGNATADNISALGQFTTNLVPNGTIDVGTISSPWTNVYATNVYGTIKATNGVVSGSSQIIQSLPSGLVSGSSQVLDILTSLNTFSASTLEHITDINTKTGSFETKFSTLQTYTTSVDTKFSTLQTLTASTAAQINKLQESTASLNVFTSSTSNRLSRLEESTSSLNSYTASLKTAISLDTTNVTILGDLTVNGTTTQINSTQVNIGENILELNFGGSANTAGIYTKDATGGSTTSGSLLWDATNDYWKAGKKDLESKILLANGDNILSSSAQLVELNSFTQSSNLRLNNLESKSASVDISIANLNIVSSSVNDFTASTLNRLGNLESKSSSIDIIVSNLQISSSNLNIVSASLNSYTASNDITNTNQDNRLSKLEESTSSLNAFTTSVAGHISDINDWTGSQKQKDTTLENVTSSLNLITASFNTWTGSTYSTFSQSVDDRLDDLEYTVTVLDPDNIGDALLGINTFTGSANNRLNNLEATTSSLNSFSSSINDTIKIKLNTDGVISGSSQVSYVGLSNIPAGIISSSAQIDTLFNIDGLISGSSQVSYTGLSNIPVGIVSGSSQLATSFEPIADATHTLVSGSSQVIGILSSLNTFTSSLDATYATEAEVAAGYEAKGRGIVSGSSQITPLLPVGTVSGSSQVVGILSSLNTFTSSLDATYATEAEVAAGYEAKGRGIVSGSSQIIGILSSLNSFTSSLDATYATEAEVAAGYEAKGRGIVSGSSQVSYTGLSNIPGGIVSGSSQILGGSNILSGSNQSNITSINQNLGTATTGVQFASLGIGTAPDATYELKIAGDVAASGDIVAYYTSDKRLKDNIQPIENALDRVNQLGGYTFDWNEELQKARKGHDIGVIAQEVQSTFPEVVVERDNGYLGVDYQKLVPVLIEAIKELSAKVKELENK